MKAIAAPNGNRPEGVRARQAAAHRALGSGSSQAGLAIGKAAGEGTIYAKDLSRPMVFTVENSLVDELKKPADDFRVKDIFDARAFNTTRVEAVRERTDHGVRESGPSKDVWKQVAPRAKDADATKVDALTSALTERARPASSRSHQRRSTSRSSPSRSSTTTAQETGAGRVRPQGVGRASRDGTPMGARRKSMPPRLTGSSRR